MPAHHAILIGINAYKEKPLRGCVRDVQSMKEYFEQSLDSVNIQMLTATENTDVESAQNSKFWPTDDNIFSAFKKVTELAKAGDHVYIHYSGHGTRMLANNSRKESTGNLALVVLTRDEQKPVRYISGLRLAHLLNDMIARELVVTLVLDCCFSASVYRHDEEGVRFLSYNVEIDSAVPPDSDLRLGDPYSNDSAYRDVSMLSNWLMDPDKYAILVACGPHEQAGEIRIPLEQIAGTLSYFLLNILKEYPKSRNKSNDIYECLRAEFRRHHRRQTPVFYGNKSQAFLGHSITETRTTYAFANTMKDGCLELRVGLAQGVSNDDQFALYALDSSVSKSQAAFAIVRIIHSGVFTSILERPDVPHAQDQVIWKARPFTRESLRNFPIRLAPELADLNEWPKFLEERSLKVQTEREQCPFSFQVVLNENGEHEILDASSRGIDIPSIRHSQTSVDQISGILEHLAQFSLVRDLNNKTSAEGFRGSFDIHILSQDNKFATGCPISARNGTVMELTMKNNGDRNLYVYIYDLGPCWQVQNIHGTTHAVVEPENCDGRGGVFRKKLKMLIPEEIGTRSCQDIIKVFITSHPTSFDFLELPKLGESTQMNISDRGSQGTCDESEHWTAVSFPITTLP